MPLNMKFISLLLATFEPWHKNRKCVNVDLCRNQMNKRVWIGLFPLCCMFIHGKWLYMCVCECFCVCGNEYGRTSFRWKVYLINSLIKVNLFDCHFHWAAPVNNGLCLKIFLFPLQLMPTYFINFMLNHK